MAHTAVGYADLLPRLRLLPTLTLGSPLSKCGVGSLAIISARCPSLPCSSLVFPFPAVELGLKNKVVFKPFQARSAFFQVFLNGAAPSWESLEVADCPLSGLWSAYGYINLLPKKACHVQTAKHLRHNQQ